MARNLYVDVHQLLQGGLQLPVPTVLPFSEEFCLFYSSSFNLIYGDTESGKTWLCLAAVASVLDDGGKATIIDLDHNGAGALIGNLVKLGASVETLSDPEYFRLSEPCDRLELREVVQDQLVIKPDLVVLDSLGEILPLFRANSNSADDFTAVHAEVIKPLTRNGASVLVVDHLAKNADSRSFGPTGTGAKMRAADGLAVRVTAERQFTPGEGGKAKLQVYKDRYGGVRKHYPSDPKPVIGTFELISDDAVLEYTFHSAQVVPIRKSRNNDEQQLAQDVAHLREAHSAKPTVRQARETLKPCSQRRAIRAVNEFTTANGEAVA
jgi:recA bacterial DNA recombination protein